MPGDVMSRLCVCLSPAGAVLGLAAAFGLAGCGTSAGAVATGGVSRELVLAYDDAHATGTVAFPSMTYESVLRFALPDGEHSPIRLRLQAGAEGSFDVTIYDSTVLETPGEVIRKLPCTIAKEDVSDGKDGRWVVTDLTGVKALKGTIWVGVRKTGGEPTLWASSVVSGQAFVRNNDPNNLMGLLPTKRTPMLRLEIARQYPTIAISPGFLWDQSDSIWSLAATLIPAVVGNRPAIAAAQARREVEASQFRALQDKVIVQAQGAEAAYESLAQALAQAEQVNTLHLNRVQQVERRFEAGDADRVELTAARLEMLIAQRAAFALRIEALRAQGVLEDALQIPLTGGPLPQLAGTAPDSATGLAQQ